MKTKTLAKIVLAGTLVLGSAGCSNNQKYDFKGKIGEDSAEFESGITLLPNLFSKNCYSNALTITKPNGKVVKYIDDFNGDLKVDKVEITENGTTKEYSIKEQFQKPIVDSAQVQFNDYLKKIKEIKIRQGLNSLK